MKKTIIILIIICTWNETYAGPSTFGKGSLYIGYGISYSDALTIIPEVYNIYQYMYLGLGITNRWDIYTLIPYVISKEKNKPAIDLNLFSDGIFGTKIGILDEKLKHFMSISIAGEIKIPLSNYQTNFHTSPGQGQNDYIIKALFGKYLPFNSNIVLDLSYIIRSKEPSDQFYGLLEFSIYIPALKLLPALFISHVESFSGTNIGDTGYNFLNLNIDYTYFGFKLGLIPVKDWYIELKITRTILVVNSANYFNLAFFTGYKFNLF